MAWSLIVFTPFPIVIDFSFVPLKVLVSIFLIPLGIEIEAKLAQSSNAPSPMLVIPSGILICLIL